MTSTPKRGRGRPPAANPRTEQVLVRLTPAELAAVGSAAASDDKSVPEWLRERALESLGTPHHDE